LLVLEKAIPSIACTGGGGGGGGGGKRDCLRASGWHACVGLALFIGILHETALLLELHPLG
jgi:hypothetical protein